LSNWPFPESKEKDPDEEIEKFLSKTAKKHSFGEWDEKERDTLDEKDTNKDKNCSEVSSCL